MLKLICKKKQIATLLSPRLSPMTGTEVGTTWSNSVSAPHKRRACGSVCTMRRAPRVHSAARCLLAVVVMGMVSNFANTLITLMDSCGRAKSNNRIMLVLVVVSTTFATVPLTPIVRHEERTMRGLYRVWGCYIHRRTTVWAALSYAFVMSPSVGPIYGGHWRALCISNRAQAKDILLRCAGKKLKRNKNV